MEVGLAPRRPEHAGLANPAPLYVSIVLESAAEYRRLIANEVSHLRTKKS